MKNVVFIFWIVLLSASAFAETPDQKDTEKAAISKVIEESYIDGIFNEGNAEAVAKGWYHGCEIFTYIHQRDNVAITPAYNFVRAFQNGAKAYHPGTTFKIPYIHVSGYASIAIVEVFQDDKQIYTDYINLYKFQKEGWRIVTKTYYSHPG